jgi:hypothetical protein
LWGWALLTLICLGVVVAIARQLHAFLAITEPAGARILVIEGWMGPEDLDKGISAFGSGGYQKIITTGGILQASLYFDKPVYYAPLARDYLVRHGIAADRVIAVPTPPSARDRTYLSAVMVREQLAKSGLAVEAIDVFSLATHTRRTRLLYEMAFGPGVRIGVIASKPGEYEPASWWKTSHGAKTVIMETISWIWTVLFFKQPPRGTHEEKWGAPPLVSAPTG